MHDEFYQQQHSLLIDDDDDKEHVDLPHQLFSSQKKFVCNFNF